MRTHIKETSKSALLAFVMGIRRWPVYSQHKGPVTRKKLPFDDAIMWKITDRVGSNKEYLVPTMLIMQVPAIYICHTWIWTLFPFKFLQISMIP